MVPVVGVFKTRTQADQAVKEVRSIGTFRDRIATLTPQFTEEELQSVVATQGEQPGMFKALGAVVGGAVGAGVVETLAMTLVPGVGQVLVIGLAGGALIGALTGGAIGSAAEKSVFGPLPEQELFIYKDALRKGRTVVIATADTEFQARGARGAMERAGAESIDSARNMWWLGLRDLEKEHYEGAGGNFEEDERYFRSGFETAMLRENRDKSYEQVRQQLKERHLEFFDRDAFRKGYERGRAYLQVLDEELKAAPHRA